MPSAMYFTLNQIKTPRKRSSFWTFVFSLLLNALWSWKLEVVAFAIENTLKKYWASVCAVHILNWHGWGAEFIVGHTQPIRFFFNCNFLTKPFPFHANDQEKNHSLFRFALQGFCNKPKWKKKHSIVTLKYLYISFCISLQPWLFALMGFFLFSKETSGKKLVWLYFGGTFIYLIQ